MKKYKITAIVTDNFTNPSYRIDLKEEIKDQLVDVDLEVESLEVEEIK